MANATRKKVTRVFNQAKESLKLFEIAKLAPSLASFKKLGLATQDEMNSLLLRIEKLEAALAAKESSRATRSMPQA